MPSQVGSPRTPLRVAEGRSAQLPRPSTAERVALRMASSDLGLEHAIGGYDPAAAAATLRSQFGIERTAPGHLRHYLSDPTAHASTVDASKARCP